MKLFDKNYFFYEFHFANLFFDILDIGLISFFKHSYLVILNKSYKTSIEIAKL